MAKKIFIGIGVLVIVFIAAFFYFMRNTKSLSPQAKASYNQGGMDVTVDYCQPSKRGRLIFGEEAAKALVPYGKVWRTGANEATLIKFNQDVTVAGKPLKAGEYTLWTIPGATDWQVVINSETGQWGTDYNEKMDVFRAPVSITAKPTETETFTIDFVEQAGGADMMLSWDKTEVIIPIRKQ
ncbi:MAG: DUF2911 domain-containing protein [Spirosomataceae bacterium]